MRERSIYQEIFENLKGETNVHWLCVALNKNLNEMHRILPLLAKAMRQNLDDVDKDNRDILEEIIEFTNDLAEHIRVEQYRNIEKMREFVGIRKYGRGMEL